MMEDLRRKRKGSINQAFNPILTSSTEIMLDKKRKTTLATQETWRNR